MKSFLLFSLCVFAQSVFCGNLLVKVSNTDYKPVPHVLVINLNTEEAHYSNSNGEINFVESNLGDTLEVIHIAYKNKYHVVKSLEKKVLIELNTLDYNLPLTSVIVNNQIDVAQLISKTDLIAKPINSSQDLLTNVPGLFIGQHAGGGKAEQIFLRGFDIDHGTDVRISVDGMPVNMVSHAHGQGYSDLHFLIPEIVDNINFQKGAYEANDGNFVTAGKVDFKTKDRIENGLIKFEIGQFHTTRGLGILDLSKGKKTSAYLALDFLSSDGPYESPQNLARNNFYTKVTQEINPNSLLSISASHFTNRWNASGQIPTRSVLNNDITRFGAIDDTEGGKTRRNNIIVNHQQQFNDNSNLKNTFYCTHYGFELYSNFTFFLRDSINGDQIKQKEDRKLIGMQSVYSKQLKFKKSKVRWISGMGFRFDKTNNSELSYTKEKYSTIERLKFGDISESNFEAFTSVKFDYNNLSLIPGIRADQFLFNYRNEQRGNEGSNSNHQLIISPKLKMLYQLTKNTQAYFKIGKGFHSNDTRVSVTNTMNTLPNAYSKDLGINFKPFKGIFINAAAWQLNMEQEFVYVGDEGIVEPSGASIRKGLELSIRHQLKSWVYSKFDFNYTKASMKNEAGEDEFIPLAPNLLLNTGVFLNLPHGIYSGVNYRKMGDRAANEDNSIVATGYGVADFNIGIKKEQVIFEIQIQNVLNVDWNETQFATTSRLKNEREAVEEIHFTPGTPRFLKCNLSFTF